MRFSKDTLDALDRMADGSGLSRTAMVDQLIRQASSSRVPVETAGVGYNGVRPDPFESKHSLYNGMFGMGHWLEAARNVNDTFDFAVQSIRGTLGDNFKHSDAIALLKLMMDENARLCAIEKEDEVRAQRWDREDDIIREQRMREDARGE
jgi:hypothetical protein